MGTVTAIDGSGAQWKIEVSFDDSVEPKRVMHNFVRKISSPDTRPFIFWDKQWRPLYAAWLASRRRHEEALNSFRPVPDQNLLRQLRDAEDQARTRLEAFLADEATGIHG
jgi:hypothetical protein